MVLFDDTFLSDEDAGKLLTRSKLLFGLSSILRKQILK